MVLSADGDTDFFWRCNWNRARRHFSAISIYNLPRLRNTNISRSNERKCFHIHKKKARNRRYPRENIMDTEYADDQVLLENISAEYLLARLEQAVRGIGFYVNSDKTEFMGFLYVVGWLFRFCDISTLVGYLKPNPFLCKLSVLFQTIQFSMSKQFNFQKTSIFQAIKFSQTVLIQTIQFSISMQFSSI